MIAALDHLVILVHSLAEAAKTFEGLGFSVTPGGEHPVGTHNALVPFSDGTYLEIIAFQEPERRHDHPWWPLLATGGGLVDFALGGDDLDEDVARLADHGVAFTVRDGARLRPDGQSLAWRAARPPDGHPVPMPFLIEDTTPRELRVPGGSARSHANGAAAIGAVYVAVDDLDAATCLYQALLGPAETQQTDNHRLGTAISFRCGTARLLLVDRMSITERLPAPTQRRGTGICAALLRAPGGRSRLPIDQTEGALLYLGSS